MAIQKTLDNIFRKIKLKKKYMDMQSSNDGPK